MEARNRQADAVRLEREAERDDGRRRGEVLERAITHAMEGDRDALRYVYVRYADSVHRYACTILGDDREAEVVTEQVFATLVRTVASYDRREGSFSAWILGLTHAIAAGRVDDPSVPAAATSV